MIVLIAGASHTGKPLLKQKLLKKYEYPLPINRPLENGTDTQRKYGTYTDK